MIIRYLKSLNQSLLIKTKALILIIKTELFKNIETSECLWVLQENQAILKTIKCDENDEFQKWKLVNPVLPSNLS